MRGRLGAYTRWSKTEDRRAATQPARNGWQRKFEREVDPNNELTPHERAKRVEFARKAHYQRLALKAAKARQARKLVRQRCGARKPFDNQRLCDKCLQKIRG
jgi:hypothetical protein